MRWDWVCRSVSSFVVFGISLSGIDVAVAQDAAELPPVVVETKQAPKAKATAKKKSPSATASAPVAQPEPAPQQPAGMPRTSDGTAYGPVEGYVADSTATGIKTNTPLNEIPQSISVVGTEQMRDQGAQTLSDALRYVPGVVAEAYGIDSRTDGQLIRGTKPAYLLDGLRSNYNEFYYGNRIDPYFMERIEVLRGPSSVLYGQAPVGGLINSVSKRANGREGGEISVEYGTFDFKQVRFDHSGLVTSDGKLSYRVTGLARNSDTQVDFVEDDRYAIQPSITWRPDSATTITLLGNFQKDESGSTAQFLPHVGTIYPNAEGKRIPRSRFIGEPDDHYNTDVNSATLFVEHDFNEWLKLSHTSRYSDVKNNYKQVLPAWWGYFNIATVPVDSSIYRYQSESGSHAKTFNQDTNVQAKFTAGMLKHHVLAGVDYTKFEADRNNTNAFGFLPPSGLFNVYDPKYGESLWIPSLVPCSTGCTEAQTLTQTGVYAQDQMRFGNWIGVIGVRKDWVDNDAESDLNGDVKQKDDAVTYRAGLMYEFASGLTPYVSYAESFVPVAGTSETGEAFVPQTGRMYEVGFKYQPKGADFAINASVFDMDETGRLVYGNWSYPKQLGEVALKGFEIELTGRVTSNLSVAGGYSYTEAEYGEGTIDSKLISMLGTRQYTDVSGNQIESVPKHLASLWALWEFDQPELKGWSLGGGVRYIGKSWDSSNTLEVPSVTLFDAMIAYETEDWRWQLTGRNLEDKEYVSTCLYRGDCWLGTARTIQTGFTYKY